MLLKLPFVVKFKQLTERKMTELSSFCDLMLIIQPNNGNTNILLLFILYYQKEFIINFSTEDFFHFTLFYSVHK
jgi:hypothetical protein